MKEATLRRVLAEQLEQRLRPLMSLNGYQGGYNCCGCSTYDQILDDAIAIVRGPSETVGESSSPGAS